MGNENSGGIPSTENYEESDKKDRKQNFEAGNIEKNSSAPASEENKQNSTGNKILENENDPEYLEELKHLEVCKYGIETLSNTIKNDSHNSISQSPYFPEHRPEEFGLKFEELPKRNMSINKQRMDDEMFNDNIVFIQTRWNSQTYQNNQNITAAEGILTHVEICKEYSEAQQEPQAKDNIMNTYNEIMQYVESIRSTK